MQGPHVFYKCEQPDHRCPSMAPTSLFTSTKTPSALEGPPGNRTMKGWQSVGEALSIDRFLLAKPALFLKSWTDVLNDQGFHNTVAFCGNSWFLCGRR